MNPDKQLAQQVAQRDTDTVEALIRHPKTRIQRGKALGREARSIQAAIIQGRWKLLMDRQDEIAMALDEMASVFEEMGSD